MVLNTATSWRPLPVSALVSAFELFDVRLSLLDGHRLRIVDEDRNDFISCTLEFHNDLASLASRPIDLAYFRSLVKPMP